MTGPPNGKGGAWQHRPGPMLDSADVSPPYTNSPIVASVRQCSRSGVPLTRRQVAR